MSIVNGCKWNHDRQSEHKITTNILTKSSSISRYVRLLAESPSELIISYNQDLQHGFSQQIQ